MDDTDLVGGNSGRDAFGGLVPIRRSQSDCSLCDADWYRDQETGYRYLDRVDGYRCVCRAPAIIVVEDVAGPGTHERARYHGRCAAHLPLQGEDERVTEIDPGAVEPSSWLDLN